MQVKVPFRHPTSEALKSLMHDAGIFYRRLVFSTYQVQLYEEIQVVLQL